MNLSKHVCHNSVLLSDFGDSVPHFQFVHIHLNPQDTLYLCC